VYTAVQLKCLEAMVSIRDNITLCVCKTTATSYGLRLARASCETTDLSHPAHEIHLPKEVAVAAASILIQFLQEQEWSIGKNAPVTRSFFPTVKGAHMLFHSQLNCQISQILSGHSALNINSVLNFVPLPLVLVVICTNLLNIFFSTVACSLEKDVASFQRARTLWLPGLLSFMKYPCTDPSGMRWSITSLPQEDSNKYRIK
jgi:hypothetical protein